MPVREGAGRIREEAIVMSTLAPTPARAAPGSGHAASLTRWSWVMLPVFVAVWFVLGLVAFASLGLFGLHEGDLILMAHSVAAWLFFVVSWLLIAAAPVAGVGLAVMALRRGGRVQSWLALSANALVLLLVVYQVFDEIRMSYFPGWSWPF